MCGVLGVVESGSFEVSRGEFGAALAAIRHRGPDDDGVWSEEGVTFGHRRLSIVDLSPAGHQPMLSACQRYVITYNGEIYNHRALRAELERDGARKWRGGSDTEVLLELIAARGIEAALKQVNGMFAFALWDRREKRLFLARDRFGEKPLFYAVRGGGIAFASELLALEKLTALNLRISADSVAQYFVRGYFPAPLSIYDNVHKLPPGSLLSWRPGETPRVSTYWSLNDMASEAEATRRPSNLAAAVEELDALILKSTADRMVADVPVGVFLSGGVDSSLIAAAMQKCASRPITTLTLGFEDPRLDEAVHARAIAAHLGTRHIEEVVTAEQARAVVGRLGRIFDEPLADTSQIPTYLVSEVARRHVTVALSGDGGDEAFAGYRRHFATPNLWRRIRALPGRRLAQAVIAATPMPLLDLGLGFLEGDVKRYGADGSVGQTVKRIAPWLHANSLMQLHELSLEKWPRDEQVVLHGSSSAGLGAVSAFQPTADVDQMCLHDMRHYLPGDILAKVDRASMAVSLETRIPLLDPDIVRFAMSLPVELRMQRTTGKLVLREVLKRYVPEPLFNRPKAGFSPPIEAWLLGPLRSWAEDLLAPDQIARHGLLNVKSVREFWRRYTRGRTMEDGRAWALLQFQSWIAERS